MPTAPASASAIDPRLGWLGARTALHDIMADDRWPEMLREAIAAGPANVTRCTILSGMEAADSGIALNTALLALGALLPTDGAAAEGAPLDDAMAPPGILALDRPALPAGIRIRPLASTAGTHWGSAYREVPRRDNEIAARVAIALAVAAGRIVEARVAIGGGGAVCFRARQVEATLIGRNGRAALFALAGQTARVEEPPSAGATTTREERLRALERVTQETARAAFGRAAEGRTGA